MDSCPMPPPFVSRKYQHRFPIIIFAIIKQCQTRKSLLMVLFVVPQIDKLPHAVIASEEASLCDGQMIKMVV